MAICKPRRAWDRVLPPSPQEELNPANAYFRLLAFRIVRQSIYVVKPRSSWYVVAAALAYWYRHSHWWFLRGPLRPSSSLPKPHLPPKLAARPGSPPWPCMVAGVVAWVLQVCATGESCPRIHRWALPPCPACFHILAERQDLET